MSTLSAAPMPRCSARPPGPVRLADTDLSSGVGAIPMTYGEESSSVAARSSATAWASHNCPGQSG